MRFQGIKQTIFITLIIISGAFCTEALANEFTIKSADRLIDFPLGRFAGRKAEYYFVTPKEWLGAVFVDIMTLTDENKGELEHLNFYCISKSGKYKAALMFSLYVFERKGWRETYPYEIILRNSDYVYAVDFSEVKGFKSDEDQALFNTVWKYVNSPEKVRALIETVGGEAIAARTVYINNVSIELPPLYMEGSYYVPLRMVAETLGFIVEWMQESKTVEVKKGYILNDSFQVSSKMTADKRGIKMRLIDGNTYVQTAYVIQILKKSIEVDENGNIYIYR